MISIESPRIHLLCGKDNVFFVSGIDNVTDKTWRTHNVVVNTTQTHNNKNPKKVHFAIRNSITTEKNSSAERREGGSNLVKIFNVHSTPNNSIQVFCSK